MRFTEIKGPLCRCKIGILDLIISSYKLTINVSPRHRSLGVSRRLLTRRSRVPISLDHVLFIQWKVKNRLSCEKVWINSLSEMEVGWWQTEEAQRNGEDGIQPTTWGSTEIYNQPFVLSLWRRRPGLMAECIYRQSPIFSSVTKNPISVNFMQILIFSILLRQPVAISATKPPNQIEID